MKEIVFNEVEHSYTNINTGKRYISATQFIELFHKKFEDDAEYWKFYKAIQYCSDIDKPNKIKKFDETLNKNIENYIETYIDSFYLFNEDESKNHLKLMLWKYKKDLENFKVLFSYIELEILENVSEMIATHWLNKNTHSKIKGTSFHNYKEDKQRNNGYFEFDGFKYLIDKEESLLNLFQELKPNHVYPELRLYNNDFEISGTSDQVLILENNWIIIRDFKTNLEIKTKNRNQKLLYPVEHLDDCEWSKYTLQLSLYGWMLEQYGFKVKHLEFEHFELDENHRPYLNEQGEEISTIYEVPYLKDEVEAMLNFYKNTYLSQLK